MARGSNPKRERKLSVWIRDEWACVYCGVAVVDPMDNPPRGITATVDHVVARSKGGSHRASNLVTACWNCNKKRGDGDVVKVTRSRTEVRRLSSLADQLRAAANDRETWEKEPPRGLEIW